MIPTLSGRIQTRLLLFVVLGIPITLLFSYAWDPLNWIAVAEILGTFLVTVTTFGVVMDCVYIGLQKLRWDRDWPFAFQFFFSIVEFGIVLALAGAGVIPWLSQDLFAQPETIEMAVWHFSAVFVPSFLALLGPISVFLIRWRFKAGQMGKL